MDKNDLDALKASFRGVKNACAKLQQMEDGMEGLAAASPENPPKDLIHAATAHAIAGAAFSGLLHRLFTPGGVAPTKLELTDSSDENAT